MLALKAHIKHALPDYMVPSMFMQLDALPLTNSGKIDRKALPKPEVSGYVDGEFEEPVGWLETLLADTYHRLFGISKVGRHADFFEIGGHSLNAVRYINMLESQGYQLSLEALFRCKTIALMAKELSVNKTMRTKPVLLNDTHTLDEAHRPLFLAHEGTGLVFYYSYLAKALEPHMPVYGLQLMGSGISLENLSIQTLATEYIALMKTVQKEGPYRIAGWSAGGSIAYEIAYQLLGFGDEVEFLGLLDYFPQHEPPGNIDYADIVDEFIQENAAKFFGVDADYSLLINDITLLGMVGCLKKTFSFVAAASYIIGNKIYIILKTTDNNLSVTTI